ncbi:MAG: hypothetical protein U1G05_03880 [Kiritimatiellia bacterium]
MIRIVNVNRVVVRLDHKRFFVRGSEMRNRVFSPWTARLHRPVRKPNFAWNRA